jgi:hypothetical protein
MCDVPRIGRIRRCLLAGQPLLRNGRAEGLTAVAGNPIHDILA